LSRLSISDGLEFMLGHFGDKNSLWPKFIGAGDNWHVRVDKPKEAISRFYSVKLMDCRICPYPDFVKHYRKSDVREAWTTKGEGIIPNTIMIDVDGGMFARSLYAYTEDAINAVLHKILDKMDEKFHIRCTPTILSSGNGFHIYQPVQLHAGKGQSWCLGHTDLFMNQSKTPDVDFLRWAEYYLSDGLADKAHYTTTSFQNMYCRVPGSFNSKNGEPVRILQKWDGNRPYINWILKDFYAYLIDKNARPRPPPTDFRRFSTKWN